MNNDDTPDDECNLAAAERTGGDPTATLTFEEVYARAHGAARAVLERVGIRDTPTLVGQLESRDADRVVSTVLGAALLELERPWREELEAARLAASSWHQRAYDLSEDLDRARRQRDDRQIHADALTARLHTATTDAHRRGQLIDDVERLLGEVETNPDLDVIAGIVDEAREKLREELDR